MTGSRSMKALNPVPLLRQAGHLLIAAASSVAAVITENANDLGVYGGLVLLALGLGMRFGTWCGLAVAGGLLFTMGVWPLLRGRTR